MQNQPIPSAANVSDALRELDWKFQTMHSSMRAIVPDVAVSGPAFSVRCYAGATWALSRAIEEAPPGSILVVDGGHFSEGVLMGGLMSLRAKMRGIAGAVVDGAVRDVSELRKVGWPVFASAITPRAGTHDQQGAWNIPISCAGVNVSPGDWVVADNDGVVIVPQAIRDEAFAAARAIEQKEEFVTAALLEGDSLGEAMGKWKQSIS